ncbi:hypothetical protein IFM89_034500, partial [Coptis chinensis]
RGGNEAKQKARCWHLLWIPPPTEERPSEEEIARKAAIKEKQGQRLRDLAALKKTNRISELETELEGLEFLLKELENVKESEVQAFLSRTSYVSKQEIESAIVRVTQSLRRSKGEPAEVEEKTESSATEKYPLINISDNMLSPEQDVFSKLLHLKKILCSSCFINIMLVFAGYVGDDEATTSMMDSNGWLKTGDLCYIDYDSFLYIVDRLKELIKYKAYQVPPAELEHLLQIPPEIA